MTRNQTSCDAQISRSRSRGAEGVVVSGVSASLATSIEAAMLFRRCVSSSIRSSATPPPPAAFRHCRAQRCLLAMVTSAGCPRA